MNFEQRDGNTSRFLQMPEPGGPDGRAVDLDQ